MHYKGNCHCGQIAFEVEGDIQRVISCNCSICQRKGILMWFVPRESLKLKTPEEAISTYTFNKHAIKHRFCPTCGIHPYAEATDAQGNPKVAINIRCIEGIDIDAFPIHHHDGRSA